jgi:hypothetical protein
MAISREVQEEQLRLILGEPSNPRFNGRALDWEKIYGLIHAVHLSHDRLPIDVVTDICEEVSLQSDTSDHLWRMIEGGTDLLDLLAKNSQLVDHDDE